MINGDAPASWRELQDHAADILRESGVEASVEKTTETARGKVSVDVWAHDAAATPSQTYLIECKHWRKRVPQTVVHAFRTVVGDCGANWGAIVSSSGFQKGAYVAAQYSNVRLLSWAEFQSLFAERWFSKHFLPEVAGATDPLIEYTEPINSRIFRKADLLPENHLEEFRRLRQRHMALGVFCVFFAAEAAGAMRMMGGDACRNQVPDLPLRNSLQKHMENLETALPDNILDSTSYRSLLDCIINESKAAIAEFDEVFGERA